MEGQSSSAQRQTNENDNMHTRFETAGLDLVRKHSAKANGDAEGLFRGISLLRKALEHADTDELRASSLVNLAQALEKYSNIANQPGIMDEVITLRREVLSLRPEGHPKRAGTLNNHGLALKKRFKQTMNVELLSEAIDAHRECLQLIRTTAVDGHSSTNITAVLTRLALVLALRFERTSDVNTLSEALALRREVLELCPVGHSGRAAALNGAVLELTATYTHTGNRNALLEAISFGREAVSLRLGSHSERAESLVHLANALFAEAKETGDVAMYQECVRLGREVLQLRPDGHPLRNHALNNLATMLLSYFKQTRDRATLAESIEAHREGLKLKPEGHPSRAKSLNNLASSLQTYFNETGDLASLEEALQLHRQALNLRPKGVPERLSSLTNLATSLKTYYRQTHRLDVLKESIHIHREACDICSPSNVHRWKMLTNLAIALQKLYKRTLDSSIVDEMIELHHQVLSLQPADHPERVDTIHNLCNTYMLVFYKKGHPQRHLTHFTIANALLVNSPYFDWTNALEHIQKALADDSASIRTRLQQCVASLEQLEVAASRNPDQCFTSQPALEAYVLALRLLPRVASLGLDLASRLRELAGTDKLCRNATLRAMALGQPQMALEIFEEGKGMFWQQALRLRSTALDELVPEDRSKLVDMFGALEHDSHGFDDIKDKADIGRRVERRRMLGEKTDRLIQEIRLRPGFERFLKAPAFEELIKASENGLVVTLIERVQYCEAIIINNRWQEKVRVVRLASATGAQLQMLCKDASHHFRGVAEVHCSDDRETNESSRAIGISRGPQQLGLLGTLWKIVVEPIVRASGLPKARKRARPRVYWIPSGNLTSLPIHAAGIYEGKDRVCVSDYIVSSYIPSISVLLKVRAGVSPVLRKDMQALISSTANAPGMSQIVNTTQEAQAILALMKNDPATSIKAVEIALTTQSVTEALQKTHILHLACHGQQHVDPLQSSFVLQDGRLTVSEIMKLSLPKSFLAFLSACETAKGSKAQPDQTVHLAASMFFCGFKSVVATMWAMHDIDGPQIAREFYTYLLEKDVIELDDIPYALDHAVESLRRANTPAYRWATFMHFGA